MDDRITRLGGIRPAAKALGVPVTTVFNWTKNGVPPWRVGALEEAVRTKEDFDNLNARRGDDAR
jgi:hypothetical protein